MHPFGGIAAQSILPGGGEFFTEISLRHDRMETVIPGLAAFYSADIQPVIQFAVRTVHLGNQAVKALRMIVGFRLDPQCVLHRAIAFPGTEAGAAVFHFHIAGIHHHLLVSHTAGRPGKAVMSIEIARFHAPIHAVIVERPAQRFKLAVIELRSQLKLGTVPVHPFAAAEDRQSFTAEKVGTGFKIFRIKFSLFDHLQFFITDAVQDSAVVGGQRHRLIAERITEQFGSLFFQVQIICPGKDTPRILDLLLDAVGAGHRNPGGRRNIVGIRPAVIVPDDRQMPAHFQTVIAPEEVTEQQRVIIEGMEARPFPAGPAFRKVGKIGIKRHGVEGIHVAAFTIKPFPAQIVREKRGQTFHRIHDHPGQIRPVQQQTHCNGGTDEVRIAIQPHGIIQSMAQTENGSVPENIFRNIVIHRPTRRRE